MAKYEIADWLTPGLTHKRLVFVTFGGSAHGALMIEIRDQETGEWSIDKDTPMGEANGVPSTTGEKISDKHLNQFTGDIVD